MDVPIVLETASPTFGLSVPHLIPQNLCVFRPMPVQTMNKSKRLPGAGMLNSARFSLAMPESFGLGQVNALYSDTIADQEAIVTSAGNITATFSIPGRSNIPSDGEDHQVTIAKLNLEARLEWVAVPSMSTQTHLKVSLEVAISGE